MLQLHEAPETYERVIHYDEEKEVQVRLIVSSFRGIEYLHLRKYYLDFNEGIWVYDDVNEKKGKYYGIGFGENPPTLQGTTGYKGNIQVYEDLPNVLLVQVFGGGNANWKVASYYHFKGENLFEKFQNLRQMIKEIEE